jgi:hypothetical protein
MNIDVATPFNFGADLCRDLGLNPDVVRSIIIESTVDDVVFVKALLYLTDEQGRAVRQRLSRWKLAQREDGLSEPLQQLPAVAFGEAQEAGRA